MSQDAINDMISQFKSGTIPFFSDHGRDPITGEPHVYTWKSIMGVWTDAVQEGDHLVATVRLNKAHPDAELLWEYHKEGMPIGMSIGANPSGPPTITEVE